MGTEQQKLIIGIDPGLKGAIALYDPEQHVIRGLWDMPVKPTSSAKLEINQTDLAFLIDSIKPQTLFSVVEEVHSMPGQGVASMFKFGHGCGLIQGIMAANSIPIHYVRPQIWKNCLGLIRDKNESRLKARLLFPLDAERFSRNKDDGRAEAVLMAFFGKRFIPLYAGPTTSRNT